MVAKVGAMKVMVVYPCWINTSFVCVVNESIIRLLMTGRKSLLVANDLVMLHCTSVVLVLVVLMKLRSRLPFHVLNGLLR